MLSEIIHIFFIEVPSIYFKIIELILSSLTFLVLSITLYWVIKYTKSTEKQIDEMVVQRNLSLLPFLQVNNNKEFTLTNFGIGIARDIYIDLTFFKNKYAPGQTLYNAEDYIEFEGGEYYVPLPLNILKPDEKFVIDTADIPEIYKNPFFNFEMVCTFTDILGNKYEQRTDIRNFQKVLGQVVRKS